MDVRGCKHILRSTTEILKSLSERYPFHLLFCWLKESKATKKSLLCSKNHKGLIAKMLSNEQNEETNNLCKVA